MHLNRRTSLATLSATIALLAPHSGSAQDSQNLPYPPNGLFKTYTQLVDDLNKALAQPDVHLPKRTPPEFSRGKEEYLHFDDKATAQVDNKGGLLIKDYVMAKDLGIDRPPTSYFPSVIRSKIANMAVRQFARDSVLIISMINPIDRSVDGMGRRVSLKESEIIISFATIDGAQNVKNIFDAIQKLKRADIDWKFISQWEGGQQTKGEVPSNKGVAIGASGVTIATGVDLGQFSTAEMRKWNIPTDLLNRLLPYAAPLKRQAAYDYIHKQGHKLEISSDEANLLDYAIKEIKINALIKLYDANTKGASFVELPAKAQTVIFSVYCNGGITPNNVPPFLSKVSEQNWKEAYDLLSDWYAYDRTKTIKGVDNRRKKEGTLLKELLTTNNSLSLPIGFNP